MFADAIEECSNYTRSVHFISRRFNSDEVVIGAATLFFVNENAVALTCKHVADSLLNRKVINETYENYKREIRHIPKGKDVSKIAAKYGYSNKVTAQFKAMLFDCVNTKEGSIYYTVIKHKTYDLALIKINNAVSNIYKGHAVFAKNSSKLRRGDFLCRIGYPFPEFSNYKYDKVKDELNWISTGRKDTPMFPIEGMFTRNITDGGKNYAYELSTPGLRGQSGGPLFDKNGLVYGVQSETAYLYLGFDQYNIKVYADGEYKYVDNHPFLHVGRCVSLEVIKAFLNENHIKYYVGDEWGNREVVNG